MYILIMEIPDTIDCDICGKQISTDAIYINVLDQTVCQDCFNNYPSLQSDKEEASDDYPRNQGGTE